MHALVDEHPAIAILDRRRQSLVGEEREAKAAAGKEAEQYRTALAVAAEEGLPMPSPPTVQPGNVAVDFLNRSQILTERRRQVIGEHADELLASLEDREAKLLAEAKKLTERIDAIAGELSELVRSVRYVGREGGRGVLGFPLDHVDPGMVLTASRQGWRFVAEPLAPAPDRIAGFAVARS